MKNIIRISHQIKKTYSCLCDPVIQKYHITRCELDILLFLYNNPELNTAKDIVDKRGIIKSQASMGIERLIQKEYIKVKRDEYDKRKYRIYLLDSSMEIVEDGLKVQQTFNDILFKNITDHEQEILQNILEKIYQNTKEGK